MVATKTEPISQMMQNFKNETLTDQIYVSWVRIHFTLGNL